jgi:integrase
MPEPGINNLKAENGPEFNRIPVLLKSRKRSRGAGGAPAFLTQAEIERLLAAITNPRDHAIFSIAYRRGLRASEVGMIELRDYTPATINERVGKLYCRRRKDSYSKIYDLTKGEDKELRAWLRMRGKQPGPMFPSRQSRPIHRSIQSTMIYLRVVDIRLKEAAEKLANWR